MGGQVLRDETVAVVGVLVLEQLLKVPRMVVRAGGREPAAEMPESPLTLGEWTPQGPQCAGGEIHVLR